MKVAVLGPVSKDLITVDGKTAMRIGGIPYYCGLALQRLGADVTAYITYNPQDQALITNNFADLSLRGFPAAGTLESIITYSSHVPDTRDHLIKSYKNTLEATDKIVGELQAFDCIIYGGLLHDNIDPRFFPLLREKKQVMGNFGLFTYFEDGQFVQKHPENLIQVLPYFEYLFLDTREGLFVSGCENVEEAGQFLQAKGAQNVILTEGSNGSHLFIGKDYYKIPAFAPKKLVDTTGAGDTYEAAFIRATELFNNPEEWGRFAAMAATMSLENEGALQGSLNEVLERLRTVA